MKTFLVLVICFLATTHADDNDYLLDDDYYLTQAQNDFNQFDTDHNGYIDAAELGAQKFLWGAFMEMLTAEERKTLVDYFMQANDANGDGKITFDEFYTPW